MKFGAIVAATVAFTFNAGVGFAQTPPAPGLEVDDVATIWLERLRQANLFRTKGALDDALKGLEEALGLARLLGEQSSYVGLTLGRMGSVYMDQGRNEQAVTAFTRAISNLENSLGSKHREVIDCLTALGVCYRNLGRYGDAATVLGRVLTIAQEAGDSGEIAKALFTMGLLYSETGRYAQAVAAFRPALLLVERQQEAPQGALASTLLYLGNAYVQQSRFQEGEPILRRALRASILAYGPGSPQVAYVECGLAVLESGRGQPRAAESRLRRALQIIEATRSRDHPDLGAVLVDLAETVRVQRRYAEAQTLAERGVAIMEAAFGEGPAVVGEGLTVLANTISAQGEYIRAQPLYRRALMIFTRTVGENDMRTASALTGLAIARTKQDDYGEADVLIQRALRIEENAGGRDSLLRAITLTEYAKVLRHNGQKRHATEIRKQAGVIVGRLKNASAKATVDVNELKAGLGADAIPSTKGH